MSDKNAGERAHKSLLMSYAEKLSDDGTLQAIRARDKEIWQLKAENEALRADAERYRWLREQHWSESSMAVVCEPKKSVKLGFDCPSGGRLDYSIDAAMSKEPKA